MNSEQLIELTKSLIDHATHFDLPYVKEVYADKLFIVNVGENGVVVITRELEFNGKLSRRFLTLIWEYLSGRWQVVKESSVVRN